MIYWMKKPVESVYDILPCTVYMSKNSGRAGFGCTVLYEILFVMIRFDSYNIQWE